MMPITYFFLNIAFMKFDWNYCWWIDVYYKNDRKEVKKTGYIIRIFAKINQRAKYSR